MKSKLLIAVFVLAVISSFAFMSRTTQGQKETSKDIVETKPTQGFVLEDDVNW